MKLRTNSNKIKIRESGHLQYFRSRGEIGTAGDGEGFGAARFNPTICLGGSENKTPNPIHRFREIQSFFACGAFFWKARHQLHDDQSSHSSGATVFFFWRKSGATVIVSFPLFPSDTSRTKSHSQLVLFFSCWSVFGARKWKQTPKKIWESRHTNTT